MEYLLSRKNIEIIESFSHANSLYAFDFDGTLAPISQNPAMVRMSEECSKHLATINSKKAVAVITGRSIEDLKKILPVEPKYLVGNHGIEGIHSISELRTIEDNIFKCKKLIEDQFARKFLELGIFLEDKKYTLSLHFRNSPNPVYAENFILSNLGNLSEVKAKTGKMVINIVPENGATKGHAFLKLLSIEKTQFGFYVGDDDTDEDVFIHKGPNILTIRVGYSPNSHADYYLKEQREIARVLEILAK